MSLSGFSAAQLPSEAKPAPTRHVNPSLSFTSLPETQLEEILRFLSFSECRRFLSLCKSLWKLKRHMQANTQHLTLTHKEGQRLLMMTHIQPSETLYQQVFGRMTLLQSLNMHWYCTDDFLQVAFVQSGTMFPNLQHFKMRCSKGVTDIGLGFLGQSTCCASLETIDITFCVNTTYEGTFTLRDSNRLPNLRLIRRQPEWLDGHFETPFGDEGRREVHTYYADGSFHFSNRDLQSHGFVCQLVPLWGRQHDDDDHDEDLDDNNDDSYSFLVANIQYNNVGARPADIPEWAQLRYRPGVCLLRLPPSTRPREEHKQDLNDTEHATTTRTVLVGQCTHSIQAPPQIRPLMERVAQEENLAPLGESRYFDKTTKALIPNGNVLVHGDVIMISRIRVRPFSSRRDDDDGDVDGPMPPHGLVLACRSTTQQDRLFRDTR